MTDVPTSPTSPTTPKTPGLPTSRLRLKARDADDLEVISASLQDAIVAIGDMTYLPMEQRFVMVANRFKWECGDFRDLLLPNEAGANGAGEAGPDEARSQTDTAGRSAGRGAEGDPDPEDGVFLRTNCGICFDGVTAVRHRGVDRQQRDLMLSLLAIRAEANAIILVFAGGAMIRLETPAIECRIDDMGEPWPTRWRPEHSFED